MFKISVRAKEIRKINNMARIKVLRAMCVSEVWSSKVSAEKMIYKKFKWIKRTILFKNEIKKTRCHRIGNLYGNYTTSELAQDCSNFTPRIDTGRILRNLVEYCAVFTERSLVLSAAIVAEVGGYSVL
jgi:hypothetical protein